MKNATMYVHNPIPFPIDRYCTTVRTIQTLDLCRGDADFRKVHIVDDGVRKIVIKQCANDFTDQRRIEGWFRLAAAYRSLGIYCPAVVRALTGETVITYPENERMYYVYAEEYACYETAEQRGRSALNDCDGQPLYLGDLMRSIGKVAREHWDVVDWRSQFGLFEQHSLPYDHADETTQAAKCFAEHMREHLPAFRSRTEHIMALFYQNQMLLRELYDTLPTSCFQGDLNDTNILVDENGQFVGVIDFNVCGREPVLNYAVKEALMHIENSVLFDEEGNELYFYSDELEAIRIQAFLKNMAFIGECYPFSDYERAAFPVLFRYINPFWWEQVHAIRQFSHDSNKVVKILDWIEYQLVRDDVRLP